MKMTWFAPIMNASYMQEAESVSSEQGQILIEITVNILHLHRLINKNRSEFFVVIPCYMTILINFSFEKRIWPS